jgi:hypothetical protein
VLRPLRDKFNELEELLLHHRHNLDQSTGVPFIRLVYAPDQEVECRRRWQSLANVLQHKGLPLEIISCKGLIFEYYERRRRLEQLYTLEQEKPKEISRHIAKRASEALQGQLLAAGERLREDGIIFLVDAAFAYPYIHLGPALEACTNHIRPPTALVVFYPGEVEGDDTLLFMGKRPSGYYRARDLI